VLKERIKSDLNFAIKTKDSIKRLVLSSLLSVIRNKEIEKRTLEFKKNPNINKEELAKLSELSDEEVIKVIQSEIKKRKEAIEIYQKAVREELVQKERDELNILVLYLPEQIDENELRRLIREKIKELEIKDIKDMGKIMKVVMEDVKGKAMAQDVSRIIKEELQK